METRKMQSKELTHKLAAVRLLLLDIDGVLTSGDIVYDDHGVELKRFNVKDGLGIRLLMDAGVAVGVISGRDSAALRHRCENLGIRLVYAGVADKVAAMDQVLAQTGLMAEQTAFVGDDLPDLALMRRVGVGIAVADAVPTVRRNADMVTETPGGHGAVREVCEAILDAKGLWERIQSRYTE